MRRISVCLLMLVLGITHPATAQQERILQFRETLYDFGNIAELGGPVDHEFTFINNSGEPVLITSVEASCGCTTPGWSRDTIPPGGTGFVRAQYNPMGRPGAFNKNLSVMTSPSTGLTRLYIKGVVDPKPASITSDYPVQMGQMRVKFRVFNMGRIKLTDEKITKSFPVYNQGDTVLHLVKYEGPGHVKLSLEPAKLDPGTAGHIMITYDPMGINDYGFQNENITFWTNEDADGAMKSFSVYTNIEEKFPSMTRQELDDAPLIVYDRAEHDFGRVKEGAELNTTFVLRNDGKKELLIRKVETNCSCVSTELAGMSVQPGDSLELHVSFDTRQRRSNQQKSVTIYANSPAKPVSRIIVKAYVEQN